MDPGDERGCPAPDTPTTELAAPDDTRCPNGFDPPAPDRTEAELIAYAEGWLAGYERGQADGYAAGFATADTILKGAVAAALGRPGDDFSTAVRRANRNLAVIQYRRQLEEREAA